MTFFLSHPRSSADLRLHTVSAPCFLQWCLFAAATLSLAVGLGYPRLIVAQPTTAVPVLNYQIDLNVANKVFKVKMHPMCPFRDAFPDIVDPSSMQLGTMTPYLCPQGSELVAPDRPPEEFPNRINDVEDVFAMQVELGEDKTFNAPTHLFGNSIKIIPYADADDVKDAAGHHHRGDEVVAHYFPPGEIGFAIKHHRPLHRLLRATSKFRVEGSQDEIKLQDTHLEIVVGVVRDGRPGIVTVNNPQDYQNGGFGDDSSTGDYPMIFAKLVFPNDVPAEIRTLLMDNIRTMAVGFNAVSEFPENYDGGDPLAARNPEKIREHVKMMVQAVAGNSDAQAYFEDEENYMYCAELAFVSVSAGLLVPLNRENMLNLGVSETEWAAFRREVVLHNKRRRDQPSFFVENNDNPRIALIRLAALDKLEALKPLPEYADTIDPESQKLAFKPMTMADMIDGFMQVNFRRREMGERLAPYEAQILAKMKPGLLEMLAVDPDSESGVDVEQLFDDITDVVGKQYANYGAFREALEPLLERARTITNEDGIDLFTPPSLFHLMLKGINAKGGLIELQYVGHGLHFSMVKPQ